MYVAKAGGQMSYQRRWCGRGRVWLKPVHDGKCVMADSRKAVMCTKEQAVMPNIVTSRYSGLHTCRFVCKDKYWDRIVGKNYLINLLLANFKTVFDYDRLLLSTSFDEQSYCSKLANHDQAGRQNQADNT